MFNAVSKASTENAGLSALFSANQSLWQQAQKRLNEAPLQGLQMDPPELMELGNLVKYASEASSAMKVI